MSAELVIKVAIADDHKIFRDGIKMALKDKDYLKIIWEAEDGRDLVHKMLLKKPDVLLMDIRMPEVDGINAIGILRKEYEEVKIIVLTMYDDQEMISKMMEM
ncbi:MAG TPA: response regulator transcription factor, partial [Bacteroidia bacterium]|nr:response regulator transcription factor [Bacteroidia bacterium]